jgi:tetratricopeptide (TPR) repeat protein
VHIIEVPLLRRLLIPLVSIPLAGLLFHAQLADGLVIRGDNEFQSGNAVAASKFYNRARWFDRDSSAAAERITTLGIMSRSASFIHDAMRVADDELTRKPGDTIVRQNRALLYQKANQPERAYADWRVVALQTNNPVIVEFAARNAERHHQFDLARRFYQRSLELNPRRVSARNALARLDREFQ